MNQGWLKFTTLTECENALTEINKRMGLNGNVTATFALPREDVNGAYVIPKPKQKVINKIETLVRPIQIESENIETGEMELVDSIEIVKKQFDEEGNDITEYDGTEYLLTKQTDLSTEFAYEEVESVEFPVIEEEV